MYRTLILALVAVAAIATVALRKRPAPASTPALGGVRLVELGSTSCRSCKAMHEELARLRDECGGSLPVEEIDVWQNEAAAKRYRVDVIPTQVLLDANDREVDRHVGYLPRAEIRARFAKLGVACKP